MIKEFGGEVSYRDSENFGIRLNGVIYLADDIFATESDFYTFTVIANDGEFNGSTQVHLSVSGSRISNITEIELLMAGIVMHSLLILIIATASCICYHHW